MKRWRLSLAALLLPGLLSGSVLSPVFAARHRVGPVTMRGVVLHLRAHDFVLRTTGKGDFQVDLRPATTLTEKGAHHPVLHESDHVGVRGFVNGRRITAVAVRVYPVKPKPRTLTGIVTSIHGSQVVIDAGGHATSIRLGTNTTIVVGSQQGMAAQMRAGDRVRARVQQTGQATLALDIHVYRSRTSGRRVDIRGTVTSVAPSGLTISGGSTRYNVQMTPQTRIYTGNHQASVRALGRGDKVTVFACCAGGALTATSIHMRQGRAGSGHVQLRGTVVSATSRGVTLRSGSRAYAVTFSASTRFYVAGRPGTARDVQRGRDATIYACCTDLPLVATSIHLRPTPVKRISVLLRGRVLSVSGDRLRLAVGSKSVDVTLISGTTYDRAATTVTRSSVHPGDQVSVRGFWVGAAIQAQRIHVYVATKRSQSVRGTVTSVTSGTFTVRATVGTYTVAVPGGVPVVLNHVSVRLGLIKAGDQVRVTGQAARPGALTATRVIATRRPVRVQTVRGTLVQIQGGVLVVVDDLGQRRSVKLGPSARPMLHGRAAPMAAMFPGVRVTARGTLAGTTLLAQTVTISVRSRKVDGRVVAMTRSSLLVSRSAQTGSRIDLPTGVTVVDDSGRRLALTALHVGTYVHIDGYDEGGSKVRAASIQVQHPSIIVSGAIVASGSPLVVRSPALGDYRVRISSATSISSGRAQIVLLSSDLRVGTQVRVQGTVRTDGVVAAEQIDVRLVHAVLRGAVTTTAPGSMMVDVDGVQIEVRLQDDTQYVQGTHDLAAADLVVGDDVSADGYRVSPTTIVARKIAVHRRLEALDGTVTTVNPDGFTVATSAGSTRVITSDSTVYAGAMSGGVAVGEHVHVSGYHRGDGVILATHVRVDSKRSP